MYTFFQNNIWIISLISAHKFSLSTDVSALQQVALFKYLFAIFFKQIFLPICQMLFFECIGVAHINLANKQARRTSLNWRKYLKMDSNWENGLRQHNAKFSR